MELSRGIPSPENSLPAQDEVLAAFDYPESEVHQQQFDGILGQAMARCPAPYQKVLAMHAEKLRWSYWPTTELPDMLKNEYPDRMADKSEFAWMSSSWSFSAMNAYGLDALVAEVQDCRRPQLPLIETCVRQWLAGTASYKYVASLDTTHQQTYERPLTPAEHLTAEQNLKSEVAQIFSLQPEQVQPDHTGAGRMFQRGLAQLDEKTTLDKREAAGSPHEAFFAFWVRVGNAVTPHSTIAEIDDTNYYTVEKVKGMPLALHQDLIQKAEIILTGGAVDSARLWAVDAQRIYDALVRSYHSQTPYSDALAEGLNTAVDQVVHDVTCGTSWYSIEQLAALLSLTGVPKKPMPSSSVLAYPSHTAPFDFASARSSGLTLLRSFGSKLTVPASRQQNALQSSDWEARPTVHYGEMGPAERRRFATRRWPLADKSDRLLQVVPDYKMVSEGSADMVLQLHRTLPDQTAPFVAGYDLLAHDAIKNVYRFTKAAHDPCAPAKVPIDAARQTQLAEELDAIGLSGAAEALDAYDTLTLSALVQTLADHSRYIKRTKNTMDLMAGR